MTRDREDECAWAAETVLLTLHALEPGEEAVVARHARGCRRCRDTVREIEEDFAVIGEAAAVAPPPGLRDRILAAAHDGVPSTAEDSHEDAAPVRPRASRPAAAGGRRWGPRRWAVLAAAVAVVVGMAGAGFAIAQLDRQRAAATVHAATVDDLLAAIAIFPHAVLVDRDRHPIAAVALKDPPQFYALDLPEPSAGRTWVLWGAHGRTVVALATVSAGREAAATPVGRQGDYTAYLLTQEASGALPVRPSDVLASGPVLAPSGS